MDSELELLGFVGVKLDSFFFSTNEIVFGLAIPRIEFPGNWDSLSFFCGIDDVSFDDYVLVFKSRRESGEVIAIVVDSDGVLVELDVFFEFSVDLEVHGVAHDVIREGEAQQIELLGRGEKHSYLIVPGGGVAGDVPLESHFLVFVGIEGDVILDKELIH